MIKSVSSHRVEIKGEVVCGGWEEMWRAKCWWFSSTVRMCLGE